MSLPVRTSFHIATDYGDKPPREYTLREALEWYKRVADTVEKGMPVSPLEQRLTDEAWVALVAEIAEREGILPGPLSYFLGELALKERDFKRATENELMAAVSYPEKPELDDDHE
jgi:hypothetical protein